MKRIFSFFTASLAAVTFSYGALADGGAKYLGNITTNGAIRSDFSTYWNQITPENGCKWGSIHSLSNGNSGTSQFSWDNYDKCESAYNWAKEKPGERHFKFHALVWGSQYPNFLCKKKNTGITVELTKQYITEWFDAVAAKFPDLEYIDVVNEAIWSGDNYHSGYGKPAEGANGISTDDTECGGSYIIEALGGDSIVNGKHQYNFITNAFKMARERWPKAVLIYNDYNTLTWQIDEGIELVKTIIANGAPVDAYGQQSHDCKGLSASDYASKMTKVHEQTGLPLIVSEYDIGEADDTKQKEDYANQIPFMWETPWVAGITIWGYIDGSTWASNTGIITSGGQDRAAMTWLKSYFASNLDKGQNTTEFGVVVEPEPQTPYDGKAWDIPGKIEAENFDTPGVGSGNDSYSVSTTENKGDSDYRSDTPVSIYKKATGNIVGYNSEGNWYEYTVNVAETGTYTMYAAVAAAGSTSSFKLSMDGKDITDTIVVPAAASGEENYDDYNKVSTDVNLTAGEHILRLTVTGAWFDIDYMTFVTEGTDDPEPIEKSSDSQTPEAGSSNSEGGDAIGQTLQMTENVLSDYDVFDMQGKFLGRQSAYTFGQAVNNIKMSKFAKTQGVFYLRNRTTGKMQSVRIVK